MDNSIFFSNRLVMPNSTFHQGLGGVDPDPTVKNTDLDPTLETQAGSGFDFSDLFSKYIYIPLLYVHEVLSIFIMNVYFKNRIGILEHTEHAQLAIFLKEHFNINN